MYRGSNDYDAVSKKTPPICRSGPIKQRNCTDITCCLLYLLLIAAVIALAIVCTNNIKLTST